IITSSAARHRMPCRSRGFAVSGTATAREIIDRLYALPFDKFTWERNQAERELRRAGQREQAEQAKTVRKPTAAAAAANHRAGDESSAEEATPAARDRGKRARLPRRHPDRRSGRARPAALVSARPAPAREERGTRRARATTGCRSPPPSTTG